jgi:hypothetical protein
MPSADQVPIESPHSRMRRGEWVVLIAGSTGSALRAVRPPTSDVRRDPLRRKRDGFLVTLAQYRARDGYDLVGLVTIASRAHAPIPPAPASRDVVGPRSTGQTSPVW